MPTLSVYKVFLQSNQIKTMLKCPSVGEQNIYIFIETTSRNICQLDVIGKQKNNIPEFCTVLSISLVFQSQTILSLSHFEPDFIEQSLHASSYSNCVDWLRQDGKV